jgi:hypothetical protein
VRAFREECGSAVAASFAASFALQEVLAALRAGAAAGGGGGGVPTRTLLAVLRIAKDVRIGVGAAHRLLGQFGRAAWCEALIRHAKGEDAREKFAAIVSNLNALEDALWVVIDPDHTRDHSAHSRRSGDGGATATAPAAVPSASGPSEASELARTSETAAATGLPPSAPPQTPAAGQPASSRGSGDAGAQELPPPPPSASPQPSFAQAAPGKYSGMVALRKSGQHRVTALLWLPEAPPAAAAGGSSGAPADAPRNTSSVDLAGSPVPLGCEAGGGGGGAHGCAAWAAHRHIKVVNLSSSVATLIAGVEGVTAMCAGSTGERAGGDSWPARAHQGRGIERGAGSPLIESFTMICLQQIQAHSPTLLPRPPLATGHLWSGHDSGCLRVWSLHSAKAAAPALRVGDAAVTALAFDAATGLAWAGTEDGGLAVARWVAGPPGLALEVLGLSQ